MICIPIMAQNDSEALEKMAKAAGIADMIEIRLDVMNSFNLRQIIDAAPKKVLVTYRSKREGGQGKADYSTRVRFLMDAIENGADFVDVEYVMPLEYQYKIFQSKGSSKLILSNHLLNKTPSSEKLEELLRKMASCNADVVKIVTHARTYEDNLKVLGLIPFAKTLGVKIITFCMGPFGRISRIMTHLMGGYLTFASLEDGEESATGQIPARELRNILKAVGT
jgi:3-dehydroquinate dehydratase type I